MHFSDTHEGKGGKFAKIAIVTVLHIAGGAALMHSMNAKVFTMPKALEEIVMFTPEAPQPPPPPEPPQPKPKPATQPKVFTPPVEVEVAQEPPVEAVIEATTQPDPAPVDPGPAVPEAPPASSGKLFSAALANASDCAKPDYPASAARNGETGTVKLALLIGPDGRVSDSKVQRSSGSRDLDRAAVAALSLCKFKPAMENGAAVPAWGQIAYVWTLD